MQTIRAISTTLAVVVLMFGSARAEKAAGRDSAYAPTIDSKNFVAAVDHRYYPLTPGSRYVYRQRNGEEKVEVTVTDLKKSVLGVSCTVVMSREFEGEELVEETLDWFAQDLDGNVWYFGEDTHRYEDGKPAGSSGSWQAGVDGAQPGIIMKATPRVGDTYRQEYLPGHAEDMGEVVRLDDTLTVPCGHFAGVVVTRDTSPLEPGAVELKFYAPGVGLLMEQEGDERVELVSYSEPDMAIPDLR
jgi:hypothetical protein